MKPGVRDKVGRSGSILLVEDSDVVRDVIACLLESGGFTVLKASGGEEALSISRRKGVSIDLLLTDIVMPEMGGVELADRVAAEQPEIRILFMTGYADDVVLREGVLGKNRECIGKPFSQMEIVEKVREILSP